MEDRTCVECGATFTPRDRRGKYCSSRCRIRVLERNRPKRPSRGWHTIQCAWCGHDHRTRNKSRHCSQSCAGTAVAYDGKSSPIRWARCDWCGRLLSGHSRKWCSEGCRQRRYQPVATDLEYGGCRECGGTFVRRAGQLGAFCSAGCSRRAGKRTRRHRVRTNAPAESFTLREIAERDNWRCHICGRRVGRGYPPQHDRAPSIDHLVPVVDRGPHARANVALAHRICNSTRRDLGEVQLRLVG